MNRNCHGDFFTLNDQRWYRCFADSAIIPAIVPNGICTNCNRKIVGTEQGECGWRMRAFVVIEGNEYEMSQLSEKLNLSEHDGIQGAAPVTPKSVSEEDLGNETPFASEQSTREGPSKKLSDR